MNRESPERLDYFHLPGLEDVYLEGSYVLGIDEDGAEVRFRLELVLGEKHPEYTPPEIGEQYRFKRAEIIFPQVTRKRWLRRSMRPNPDPSGEVDFGNIDEFYREAGEFHISGEWGEMVLAGSVPQVKFI